MTELRRLQEAQSGLATRAQLLAGGVTRTELARALRRGLLVAVHPGVYVSHNGPLTWLERAWAAVLWAAPAALCLDSARRLLDGRGLQERDDSVIHVLVARERHLDPPARIRIHRSSHFEARVQGNLSPPCVRYDETILDLAARARDDLAAVAVLADACGSRRTTAARLIRALDQRPRMHRRSWTRNVLVDVASGTCSVLEHGYLDLVERPHGLPRADRQALVPRKGSRTWQDVRYEDMRIVVELDGRLFHTSAADRDRDLERDLDSAVARQETTLRVGYRQVFERGCITAAKVAAVLMKHGWPGPLTTCPKCGGVDQPA